MLWHEILFQQRSLRRTFVMEVKESFVGEYFRPWWRKLGVLTLVASCGLAAIWIRSHRASDFAHFRITNSTVLFFVSSRSMFFIQSVHEAFASQLTLPPTGYAVSNGGQVPTIKLWPPYFSRPVSRTDYQRVLETQEWTLAIERPEALFPDMTISVWSTPDWSLAIPLTLLSAYLLLGKPRAVGIQPPTANEG